MKLISFSKMTITALVAFWLGACSEQPEQKTEVVVAEPEPNLHDWDAAAEYLLANLKFDSEKPVEIHMHREMLRPGDVVKQVNDRKERYISNHQWFALIDKVPGAFFEHPVEYVYLERDSKNIYREAKVNMPMLNGMPIWEDEASYFNANDLIYTNLRSAEVSKYLAFPEKGTLIGDEEEAIKYSEQPKMYRREGEFPKRRFALLMNNFSGGPTGEDIRDNLYAMAEALRANGFVVQEFVHDAETDDRRPYVNLGDEKAYSLFQIKSFIYNHDDRDDCCEEIFIYYTGQNSIGETVFGKEGTIDVKYGYGGEEQQRKAERRIYPEDLADMFRALKSQNINFVIDANYSGTFVDDLLAIRGVQSVATSCGPDEYAYTGVYEAAGEEVDPHRKQTGERGSEFTSGFVKGLLDFAATRTPFDPLPTGAELVEIGFKTALQNDVASLAGMTHPTAEIRRKPQ